MNLVLLYSKKNQFLESKSEHNAANAANLEIAANSTRPTPSWRSKQTNYNKIVFRL